MAKKHSQLKPYQFKKGQSGNPAGGSLIPEIVREARKLSKLDFEEVLHKYIQYSDVELKKLLKND